MKRLQEHGWLIAVVLAASGVCLCFSTLDLNFFSPYCFSDIGHQLTNYESAYRGGVPYLDFWENWAPGSFYINVLAFAWFGVSIYSTKLLLALTLIACAAALFLISRRLVPEPMAAVVVVVCLLWGNVSLNIPYSGWFAICFSMLALLCVLKSAEKRERTLFWLLLAGVAVGAVFSVKQNIGLVSFVAAATASAAAIHTAELADYARAGDGTGSGLSRIPFILVELCLLAAGCLLFPYVIIRALLAANVKVGIEHFAVFFLPVAAIDACVAASLVRAKDVDFGRMFGGLLKKGAALACGFALVVAPWFVWLSQLMGWKDFYRVVLVTHPLQESFRRIYPTFGQLGGLSVAQILWFAALVAVCGLICLLFIYAKARRLFVVSFVIGAILLLLVVRELVHMGSGYAGMFYYPPLLAGAAFAYLIARGWSGDNDETRARRDFPVLAATLFATHTFMTLATFADGTHYHMVIFPWIILAGWAFSVSYDKARSILPNPTFASTLRGAGLVVATALPFFGPFVGKGLAMVRSQYEQNVRYCEEFGGHGPENKEGFLAKMETGSRGGIYVNRAFLREIDEVVLHIRANTSEHDYLLVVPSSGVFNFLAERRPPSRYRYFLFDFLSEQQQRELLEDLRKKQPAYIIMDTGLAGDLYRDTLRVVTGYMDGRYTWERKVGRFHLFRRSEASRQSQN